MNNTTLVGLMPAPAGVVPDFDIHHMTDTQLSFILAYGITLGLATILWVFVFIREYSLSIHLVLMMVR
jgi:hypothetical protein